MYSEPLTTVHSLLYHYYQFPPLEHFHLPKQLYLLNNNSLLSTSSSPHPPAQYFVSMNLSAPGMSCKWNNTIFLCVLLISLSIISSRCTHVATAVTNLFFFNGKYHYLLCICHIFLFILLLMDTWIFSPFNCHAHSCNKQWANTC